MENVIMFFCDIHGTLKGNIENDEIDYINLNSILNTLSSNNDNCKIIFTLLSSESKEELNSILKPLKKYLNGNILFHKQFYEKGFIKGNTFEEIINGKFSQMIYYLREIKEKANILSIYYADDSVFLQDLIDEYIKINNIDTPLEQIIPTEKEGLKEVNKILSLKLGLDIKK